MSKPRSLCLGIAIGMTVMLATTAARAGDSATEVTQRGQELFTQCQSCHAVGAGAQNGVGPQLNGLIGRKIASAAGFQYSRPMKEIGADGRRWDATAVDGLLKSPEEFAPGSPMVIKVGDPDDRAALIAFLTLAGSQPASAVVGDPPVSEEILGITGDPEYGEYLAGECVTCHQADGSNKGIPSITGWPAKAFVNALHAYKRKHRSNPVMQNVTQALGNDEIAALAAWFETQK